MIQLPVFNGDAACADVGGDLWFPEQGGRVDAAIRICSGCEIRVACLKWALDNDEQGLWGGISETQRKQLRRRKRAAA